MQGKIEHIAQGEKGFGFIKVDGYEKNVFFHAKNLLNASFEELHKGDLVTVETIEETEKGFSAKGIRLL